MRIQITCYAFKNTIGVLELKQKPRQEAKTRNLKNSSDIERLLQQTYSADMLAKQAIHRHHHQFHESWVNPLKRPCGKYSQLYWILFIINISDIIPTLMLRVRREKKVDHLLNGSHFESLFMYLDDDNMEGNDIIITTLIEIVRIIKQKYWI